MLVGGHNGLFTLHTHSGQVTGPTVGGDIRDVHVSGEHIAVVVGEYPDVSVCVNMCECVCMCEYV